MTESNDFAALCQLAAKSKTLQKLVFSVPVSGDIVKANCSLRRVGEQDCLQIESFYKDNKAKQKNVALAELNAKDFLPYLHSFARVNLLTTAGNAEYRLGKKGEPVLIGSEKLTNKLKRGNTDEVELGGNNNEKKHILNGSEPFLKLLGVSDENGRIYDKKGAKFRQINRFLELVRDTLEYLPKDKIRILDLCCGKSYLSFAVYHYFANVLGMEVSMTGVDLKADVIDYCNQVAEKLNFNGLSFLCGDICKYESEVPPQLVVSLHACDTATDLVLEQALRYRAKVILSTPCCHHELNHTLNCPTLSFIAEHSMLRQKFCDAATDALRLKLLESKGYEATALELIDPDDTPKNIMLRGILKKKQDNAAMEKAAAAYAAAKAFLLGGN